ncbi:uncharacterized protein LOC144772339 isoform X2 [Lissotriton helveticus]
MVSQGSEKALLTFQDVVACFSQVERELLHKWQKDVYTNVMKEIHQIFLLLGPVIANSVFSLRAKENEGLCPLDDEDPDRSNNDSLSQSATLSKLDVCTASRDVVPCLKNPMKTDRKEGPKLLCTERWGNPDLLSKDRIESPHHLDADRRRRHDPLGTDSEESSYPRETDRRKSHDMLSTSQMNWCKEQDLTIVMISDSIKEEEKPFPMAELNPGDVKNFPGTAGPVITNSVSRSKEKEGLCPLDNEDPDRRHKDSLSQKQEFTIEMTSNSIKEEEEAFPMAELNPGDVKNSRSPAEQSKEDSTSEKEPHAFADYKKVSPLKSTTELHKTIQTDNNLFTCTVCEQSFTEKESLQVHLGIHRGIKLFPCNKCEKSFTQKANLQRHMRIHMGVKPFPCTECEKSFRQYCDMQRHMRIHTGVKPFHCTECGKRFTQKAHLQGHLRIHTVVKPLPCPECEKSFTQHCDHQCHRRIQTGGKPFHCTVCGRSFSLKTTLQCHMKTHTRAKPFS